MAEILIYNGALSDEEILAVNRYLGEKYGIQVAASTRPIADWRPRGLPDVGQRKSSTTVHVRSGGNGLDDAEVQEN